MSPPRGATVPRRLDPPLTLTLPREGRGSSLHGSRHLHLASNHRLDSVANMPWPTQLDVLLRPGEVRVVRRPLLLGGRRAAVAQAYPVSSMEAEFPWHGCIEVLAGVLQEQIGARALRVVLSDHFVRYALVPWNASLVADVERLAFARLALSQIYGSLAEDWAVTLDQQPAGQASFACAMDRDLLQALRELASGRRMRLQSVSAALTQRINRHRAALSERVFCLASLEPGRLTLAFRNESGWLAVRTRRVNGNPLEALAGVLRQEAAAAGAGDGGCLYLIADAATSLPSIYLPNWKTTRLNDGTAAVAPGARALVRMAAAD